MRDQENKWQRIHDLLNAETKPPQKIQTIYFDYHQAQTLTSLNML